MKFSKQQLTHYASRLLQGLEWARVKIEKLLEPIFPPPKPIPFEDQPYADKLSDLVEGSSREEATRNSRQKSASCAGGAVHAMFYSLAEQKLPAS